MFYLFWLRKQRHTSNHREIISKYLNVPESRFLDFKLFSDSKELRPCYYVVDDPENRFLVLAIRGTMSSDDVFIDLLYEYFQLEPNVYVHYGVHVAARYFIDNLANSLIDWACNLGYDRILITGHSLGGAVASLFTTYFNQVLKESSSNRKITCECYAFGSPPVLSEFSGVDCTGIKKVIFGNDIVPRLSFGSCTNFKDMMLILEENQEYFNFLAADRPSKQQMLHFFAQNRDLILKRNTPRLSLIGEIYHVIPQDNKKEKSFKILKRDSSYFDEMKILPRYFFDHFPSAYDEAFQWLLAAESENQKKKV